jgi:beta-glucosidase
VARELGGQIDWLCTINEANLSFGPQPELMAAAAQATGSATFACFMFDNEVKSKPVIRAAHAAARQAIKAVHPNLPVGYTLAMSDYQPVDEASAAAAERLRRARYGVWLEAARQDDFLGVQTYTRELVGPAGPLPVPEDALKTQIGQEFYPRALEGTIRYAASVAKVPIVVTENGVGTEDDARRIEYIDGALAGLRRCLDDDIDVRGYLHWSAMDNYEWLFGYKPKFGLVAVDRATQKRTPKPSAHHLGHIAKANRI